MSTTATAKRRRRSAAIKYRDMAPMDRPHYRKTPKKNAGNRYAEARSRGWKG